MASIMQAVNEKEQKNQEEHGLKQEGKRLVGILLGVLIYTAGVNLFLRPLHLYSGGIMGFCQLFDTILRDYLKLPLGNLDVSGIAYYLLNLPGMIIAFFLMRRRFVVKSILTVTAITLMLTVIPIPKEPILDEMIANCLVSGLMAGVGVGMILRMGSCDGGMDLLGMILIQTKGRFSVGKVNIAANCVLYGICLVLFDVPTVIYSLIYSVVCSLLCDKVHTQNINVQAMIITKMQDVEPLEIEIMGQMKRGLTCWNAYGGYTGQEKTILMAVISKYEIAQLRSIVHQFDPEAFVMMDEGVSVDGYFLKKLT